MVGNNHRAGINGLFAQWESKAVAKEHM